MRQLERHQCPMRRRCPRLLRMRLMGLGMGQLGCWQRRLGCFPIHRLVRLARSMSLVQLVQLESYPIQKRRVPEQN